MQYRRAGRPLPRAASACSAKSRATTLIGAAASDFRRAGLWHEPCYFRGMCPSRTGSRGPRSRNRRALHAIATSLLAVLSPTLRAEATATAAAAPGVQPLVAIQDRAEAAVRDALPRPSTDAKGDAKLVQATREVRITARALDPRLRLARCGGPLSAELPAGGIGARQLVAVRCGGPVRWSTWVPVTVETAATVLTASRALARGDRPGPADLQPASLVVPGISDNYVTSLEDLEGMHLVRPVAAAAPLPRSLLAPDPVVQKGEAVTLVARQGGMEIRAPGRALSDAAPGGRLRVQNVNSLKVVEGRADSNGMVSVDP